MGSRPLLSGDDLTRRNFQFAFRFSSKEWAIAVRTNQSRSLESELSCPSSLSVLCLEPHIEWLEVVEHGLRVEMVGARHSF